MIRNLVLLIICCCIFTTLQSQTHLSTDYEKSSLDTSPHSCATHLLHQKAMKEDPIYRQKQLKNELLISQELKKQSSEKMLNNPIQIPVVFHIINRGTDTQILSDDSELEAALDKLNKGFKGQLIPTFGIDPNTPEIVDTEIEFCLASFDPDGNPTTGINRVDGSSIPEFVENGLFLINENFAVKDLSRWPTSQYLNIWVVYKVNGTTGGAYANFPNGGDYDGVTMTYSNVDSKILVHEVGHWLNLFHVFRGDNDGTQCPPNSDCSIQGDRVCDTPPFRRVECTSYDCSNTPEVYKASYNFMGYCSALISRFTQGQKERMHAALAGPYRNTLQYSIGCTGVQSNIDNDNDGVSISIDCDDNDPSIPAIVGTPCDDGDSTTDNDVILADGCSCAGTTSDCPVSMVYENDNITIYGLDLVDYAEFKRSSISNNILTCNPPQNLCGPVFILSGVFPNETYIVTYSSENCSESISVFTGTSTPNCNDGIQNQGETGVDCGGPCTPCVTATCNDGIQNQGETGVDCGGPCNPCSIGGCNVNITSSNGGVTITGLTGLENAKLFTASIATVWGCNPWSGTPCSNNETVNGLNVGETYFLSIQSDDCDEWIPIVIQGGGTTATCNDGIQNQGETGIDCGGPCAPCQVTPTCNDGIQNQGETGIDCGGPCVPCQITATCNDGIQNQGETGVDCGGPCSPCQTAGCNVNVNSANGVVSVTGLTNAENAKLFTSDISAVWGCNPWNGSPCSNSEMISGLTIGETYFLSVQSNDCDEWITVVVQGGGTTATCNDGIQNQGETGIDCGGPCAPCQIVATCNDGIQNQGETGIDCGGPCAPCQIVATCNDGIQNQSETGIDCGGPCAPCQTGGCNIGVSSNNGTVTVTGLTNGENAKLFTTDITAVWGCNPWNGSPCSNLETISGLTIGETYFLSVQSDECDEWIPITVQGGSCTDSDDDGICNNVDCEPNNPNLPATPGSQCNDMNSNTTNDVILTDGCTCQGTPIGGGCNTPIPLGFTLLGEFGNSKYFMSNDVSNWDAASLEAASLGGYIVSISSQAENDFIKNNLDGNIVFIGLGDGANSSEGNLAWDSGEPYNFSNLVGGNSAAGDYAHMNFWAGTWTLDNPLTERPYILEVPCLPIPRIASNEIVNSLKINSLFPNPTSDEVFVKINSTIEQTAAITITNLMGQVVEQRTISLESGKQTMQLDLQNYPNGIYQMNIATVEEIVSHKIIKIE